MPFSCFDRPLSYFLNVFHLPGSRELSAFVSTAINIRPATRLSNRPQANLPHRDLPATIQILLLTHTIGPRRATQTKGELSPPALLNLGFRTAARPVFTAYTLPAQRRHFGYTGAVSCPNSPITISLSQQLLKQQPMASDDDYMNFLDKANKDPSEGYAKAQGTKAEFKAADKGASVPEPIVKATQDAFYVSDADEPFVPVALAWDEGGKGLPDEEEFASLIQHWDPKQAEIEIQDPVDWDSRGQYKDLIEAVRKAGKGNDVRVYRVKKDGTRAEYWIVTTEGEGKGARLVGAKALAVES